MLAIIVTINVLPGQEATFLAATADNHRHSLQEPGCRRFDVLRDDSIPTRFYLYEVYDDLAANAAHKTTPHYARWAAAVEPLMATPRSSTKSTPLHPNPYT